MLGLVFLALATWLFAWPPGSLLATVALVVTASACLAGIVAFLLPANLKKAIAGFAAAFVACAALIAALLAIPSIGRDQPQVGPAAKKDVARFSGVVGNFANSRAFLEFLADHDDGPVQLDRVGFNEATLDDFLTTTVTKGGQQVRQVTYVQVFTECSPELADGETPTVAKGCEATSVEIDGVQTDEAYGYLTHGVPVYSGFFRVDVTGVLQMGVTPIRLQPMTREQATRG